MAEHAPHYDVAGYLLGTLTAAEVAAFEAHLPGCAACRAEIADLGSLPALLRSATPAPPSALHRRTFDAITEASRRPTAPPATGITGPPPGVGPSGSAGRPATGPARPGTSGVPGLGRPGPSDLPGPGTSGPSRAPGVGPGGPQSVSGPSGQRAEQPSNVVPLRPRRSAAVRWLAAAAAALLVVAAVGIGAVVLGGDDGGPVTTFALAAGDVGSGSGEALVRNVDGGREVRLTVSGLPANPPGTYYECWFVGPGDSEQQPNRVSAGTFTAGADGTATVTMVSAADPDRFPRMGVTLEPDDGNPARTGPKYLATP